MSKVPKDRTHDVLDGVRWHEFVPMRQQLDDHDALTRECGLVCPPEENRTRQEFKDEADINNIVSRFWPFAPPPQRPVQFGEQDMGLDLHSAMMQVQEARAMYATVPEALRSRFPTYAEFVQAVADGRIVLTEGETPEVPSGGSPSGASDSAPGESAANA